MSVAAILCRAGVAIFLVAIHASSMTATPIEHPVAFDSGDVELHGTLIVPESAEPVPAIVFLHGSGPHTRAGFRAYAEEFAKLGIAGLFYDKRGTGESGGSWITSSLDDLAADAAAAVAFLAAREEIDGGRIGFWGVSQAGWVAPLAASKAGNLSFLVLISGGGASPLESERYSYEQRFAREELSETDSRLGSEVVDAYFAYLATGEKKADLVERLDALGDGPLGFLSGQLKRILPSEEIRPMWSWVATHDPLPAIGQLDCPVLLLFGELDTDHPSALAVERWKQGLEEGGNDRATIMTFPGAGHGIRMRRGHSGEGRAPFADGYLDVQLGWLWSHVVSGGF